MGLCNSCNRKSYCTYPCEKYINNSTNQQFCDKECLSNYLNYDVESDEWLEIIKGKLSIEEIIDKNSLMDYLIRQNKEYCDKNNLCEECRSKLIETRDHYEYWGSKVSQKYFVCPKCGY